MPNNFKSSGKTVSWGLGRGAGRRAALKKVKLLTHAACFSGTHGNVVEASSAGEEFAEQHGRLPFVKR